MRLFRPSAKSVIKRYNRTLLDAKFGKYRWRIVNRAGKTVVTPEDPDSLWSSKTYAYDIGEMKRLGISIALVTEPTVFERFSRYIKSIFAKKQIKPGTYIEEWSNKELDDRYSHVKRMVDNARAALEKRLKKDDQ